MAAEVPLIDNQWLYSTKSLGKTVYLTTTVCLDITTKTHTIIHPVDE